MAGACLDKLIDRAFAPSMDMILRAPTGTAYLGMTLQLAAFRRPLPDSADGHFTISLT